MGVDEPTQVPEAVEAKGNAPAKPKPKQRNRDKDVLATKRRCVSTACIACRRRKSKCDGNTPSCAACSSVYGTECIYDPNSDHRRKGVYKKDIDNLKTRNSTLQTLIQGILNYPEAEVMDLVRDIRTCDSLDDVAEQIMARNAGINENENEQADDSELDTDGQTAPRFEKELAGKMGGLRLDDGSMQFLGGTSNLLYSQLDTIDDSTSMTTPAIEHYARPEDAIRSWTTVTDNVELILHLLNMYFTWHYTYFTTLSKHMFLQDFRKGKPIHGRRKTDYCTPLLVNAMLALGCHFTTWPGSRRDPYDSATAGDHFFKEAKRLIVEYDEYEYARLATVQAFALMSVREAGCGREAKGWVYSGMSFRMASDLGLNIDTPTSGLDEHEVDARRITFWGCFLFDKCWSNYLGRSPQFPMSNITVPKFDVFPAEDAEAWSAWTDQGLDQTHSQPSRTRTVALHTSALCEISNDLILTFYRPTQTSKPVGKQAEIKRLGDFHTRLEAWRRELPKELEAKDGQLPNVLVMHMFHQLLFIHLFRPFLKYSHNKSILPAHVSPRKLCTQAAAMISKLLRMYKRTYGLRQICNIAVYIVHSACTIHLLNLPEKDARRDIIHGVKQLEEIADMWLCAGRTLVLLLLQVRKWSIDLPEDASEVLVRAEVKYGSAAPSPGSRCDSAFSGNSSPPAQSAARIVDRMTQAASPNSNNADSPSATSQGVAARQMTRDKAASPPTIQSGDPIAFGQHTRNGNANHHGSPTNYFGSPEFPYDDTKDWWLKDQSSIFDNWTRRESISSDFVNNANIVQTMPGAMNGMTGNDLAMFNMNNPGNMAVGNGVNGMNGMGTDDINGMNINSTSDINKVNGVEDLSYLDFRSAAQYGYNNGNVY